VEYKGVRHVIHALADPRLVEFDFVVAGSNLYRGRLEAIAREAGVDDRVTFAGYVDDDRLPGLYAGASVSLSLSTVEAYGMTVAESFAAGTTCVVRDTGALSGWVDHDGCVGISEPIPKAVATGILEVCDSDPNTEHLLLWDAVVDRTERVYEEFYYRIPNRRYDKRSAGYGRLVAA
jgi:glycosyltransferase involved in cell wall biosynthesis